MPDGTKPAFNPNKPFEPILADKPKFNPKEQYTVEVPDTSVYANVLNSQENQNQFENIVNNIPDLDDSKKETIRELAKKGIKGEELSNSILTLQGKHPRQDQDGSVKYYINDKGLPTPLKNNERPPIDYEVASIWGSQKDANDDAWYTDLAKTVYNVLPASAENVVDLVQTGYEALADKESENLNTLKNAANYLKFAKDEDLNKSMFNTQGIDEWSDLLDTKRLEFSPESIWGTVNGLLGSIGEFYVGGRGATSFAKGALGVAELGKTAQIASNVVASTLTNLGEVRDAATEIGLTGRDRALFTSAIAPIISAVDVKWGLAPKIFGNSVAREEKNTFLKALGNAIPRDAEGKITKEGVQELAKVTTAGYTQVAKKLGQLTANDVLQEGGQEALQQFVQNSGEQLWDKLTPAEQKKFGTDAFSPESFGEYISNGIAGLVGGGGITLGHNLVKSRDKQATQNNNAFELAKGGDEAIKNFMANVDLAVKNGNMTKDEADNALLKVAMYKKYYDQTENTKLDDEQKKTVFGLTFEKANLESQIPTEYEEDKLNAIEQAKISVKKKQAKDIQAELDKIFLADEVLQKENPSVAKKTIEEVDKHLTPEKPTEGQPKFAGSLKELYEKHSEELGSLDVNPVSKKEKKVEPVETRKFEEIPFADWNQKRDSDKFNILSENLDSQNKTETGELRLMSGGEGQSTNDTVHIKLPNDKWVILASSSTNRKTKNRGHLHIENLPEDFNGQKVTIKPTRLTTGRIVLPVYNSETGKHVGYVREDNTGKANEKLFEQRALKLGADEATKIEEKETEELQHLKTVKLTKNEIEATARLIIQNQSSVEKIAPQVETQKAELNLPTEEIERINKIADTHKESLPKVEVLTREGKTSKQISKELNIPIKDLYAIKAYLGIPRYVFGTPKTEYKKVFEEWKNKGEQYQKQKVSKGNVESTHHEDVLKVTQVIQNALPNINVIYDKTLDAAGKLSADGKTISINPYYAGIDTPIHEAGHVLIDAIGYNNNIIQKAIDQLRGTKLWEDIAGDEHYSKLSEENLAKEVLAEAIGREGEGIFDTEVQKNVFMKYLDYIFNRLKQLLGIDRNIARSLAQQIISGIGTKNIEPTETGVEQLAKVYKTFAEKTQEEQVRALTLSFDQYSEKVLKRNLIVEAQNIDRVNEALENPEISERDATVWQSVKEDLEARKKQDLREWYDYREDMKWAVTLYSDINNLEEKAQSKEITEQEFTDGLVEAYNVLNGFNKTAREAVEANLMGKIAYGLFQQGKDVLKKNEKFIEEVANKADISVKDVWLKNLGHMTEKVPELQVFGKLFDEAAFDKVEEAKEKKNTFEKLGTAVIKEVNKKLGITKQALSIFSSDSAKYFDFMDNGSGELLTLNEANDKNLSDAQIAFLKYNRELIAEHKGMIVDDAVYNMPLQVLKTDPTFNESYKQDGINQAFSNYLGTNYNLKQVRVNFKDPETGISGVENFGDIETKLIKYGKKGVKEKAHTLALLLKYNRNARVQLKKGINVDEKENPLLVKNNSQFSIDNDGILSSKFDKPRDKTRGYSKDFYRAGIEFIDDMQHVKHFSKLVPLINSIEYLNKERQFEEHIAKPNVVKWIEGWREAHLFKNPKQTLPELDITLKFLRFLTSATTMMFNAPAGVMNLAMGVYNNWRAENTAKVLIGHKRLFGDISNHKKNYGLGTINPYAIDILRKYDVVSTDYDSNPKLFVGRLFDNLAHGMTRYGEFQIQGSMFLGLMTHEEYNSFEYKKNKHGIDELVVKDGVDEKELKKKLIDHKNRVSDIQGKYSEKDSRNISNNELGKAIFQFKLWAIDFWKERFGAEYITRDGVTKRGSWNEFIGDGLKDLRADVKEHGIKAIWNNKNAMSNLKGAMFVAMFLVLKYQDDPDERKRKSALSLDGALSNLLFVFDPDQLKYMVTRPIAAMSTAEKFINVLSDVIHFEDMKKTTKDARKLLPANKAINIIESVVE